MIYKEHIGCTDADLSGAVQAGKGALELTIPMAGVMLCDHWQQCSSTMASVIFHKQPQQGQVASNPFS